MYYTYTDNLGSITSITDSNGNIKQSNRFGAWGEPLDAAGYGKKEIDNRITDRGYTGHEHLPEFRLINMNGRLYDPQLGRMLSPDNYLQSPDNTQNFNRYSYVLNNPLKYTDPSGEFIFLPVGIYLAATYIATSMAVAATVTLAASATIGGGMNVWSNKDNIQNANNPFLSGAAYFGVGAGMGVLNYYTGGLTASATQALGILPGAFIGGVSGSLTGGFTSAISGGLNNKIAGKDFDETLSHDFSFGALSGGLSGAVGGGFRGYKNARARGANIWTGEGYRYKEDYSAILKTDVQVPYREDFCYANSSGYANYGHGGQDAYYFAQKAGNKPKYNPYKLWKSEESILGVKSKQYSGSGESGWRQLGDWLQNDRNIEIIGAYATGEPNKYHAVNITGVFIGDKYRLYGGGTKRVIYQTVWDTGFFKTNSYDFVEILLIRF